jgi:adenine-specific DNA-methyltransferase
MKGFVPTPSRVVDLMVGQLFRHKRPEPHSNVLDPGSGTGAFIEGVIRWCNERAVLLPRITGIELNPEHVAEARRKLARYPTVEIRQDDFLTAVPAHHDFVIGNPPYVPITALADEEKRKYRKLFQTAKGRFDLYLLFFEQALRNLAADARLVFITPEKFLYVETATALRRLLADKRIEEIRLVEEQTFGELVTYPTITTLTNSAAIGRTRFVRRSGEVVELDLPGDGRSWLAEINGGRHHDTGPKLRELCLRVSCGVATGADSVFVRKTAELDSGLAGFAYPTIAGRELGHSDAHMRSNHSILIPYSREGKLLEESRLGPLAAYLSLRPVRARLMKRTCVKRKPWYAFHETPPLSEILRPKILCKDITSEPRFWIDRTGRLVPRHSTYYIVPKDRERLDEICEYLNSEAACRWLRAHCQRAANGFLRIQSRVLKELPVPSHLAPRAAQSPQQSLFGGDSGRADLGRLVRMPQQTPRAPR